MIRTLFISILSIFTLQGLCQDKNVDRSLNVYVTNPFNGMVGKIEQGRKTTIVDQKGEKFRGPLELLDTNTIRINNHEIKLGDIYSLRAPTKVRRNISGVTGAIGSIGLLTVTVLFIIHHKSDDAAAYAGMLAGASSIPILLSIKPFFYGKKYVLSGRWQVEIK